MTPQPSTQSLAKALGGIPLDDKGATRLINAIVEAVHASFVDRETQTREPMKEAEVKRRTELCYEITKRLIGDLKWSTIKTADHLTHYLRCEILGISYTPGPAAQSWSKMT